MKNTIILIDDHDMMRKGLAAELGQRWKILGEADSLESAEVLVSHLAAEKQRLDMVLLDIDLRGSWSLDLVKTIKESFTPTPKVIVYSVFDDFAHIKAALRVGVEGYVCKAQSQDQLQLVMEKVLAGETALPAQLSAQIGSALALIDSLTRRERQILELIQLRHTNTEIAVQLGISQRTVENNISIIYDKTGTHTRRDLEKM
jgi:DNA-binding NarL/FixJ family response regulator